MIDNPNLNGRYYILTFHTIVLVDHLFHISILKTCLYHVIFYAFLSRLLSTSSLQSYPFPKFYKDFCWPKFVVLLGRTFLSVCSRNLFPLYSSRSLEATPSQCLMLFDNTSQCLVFHSIPMSCLFFSCFVYVSVSLVLFIYLIYLSIWFSLLETFYHFFSFSSLSAFCLHQNFVICI